MTDRPPFPAPFRSLELRPGLVWSDQDPPLLIAGPCVVEGPSTLEAAHAIAEAVEGLPCLWVFKASFDKANRTSTRSARGPGLQEGLALLARVREELGVPVLTDVHLPEQCDPAAASVDLLQIPAFLSRQTDLVQAAARTGLPVNIKKAQFMAPSDVVQAARKAEAAGGSRILLTERGTFFGYGRLVVDFSGLPEMQASGFPVILDGTHAVQRPSGLGDRSGGDWRLAPTLLRAGAGAGFHGYFVETHPEPDRSPSDGPNMIPVSYLREILEEVFAIHRLRSPVEP